MFAEGSTRLHLTIKQSGNVITGKAQTEVSNNYDFQDGANIKGEVSGDQIEFSIERENSKYKLTEIFHGAFDEDGRISGKVLLVAFDGNVNVPWRSDRAMKCLYKPVTKLGTKHSDPAPAQTGAPYIVAVPNNIRLPFGQTAAVSNITWDAGPDHPYAEVWVKVDGRDETKVLEKGKGTLPVQIIAGSTYVYILTDDGTTLATVTVQFRR
jgi:hypothetical protein